MRARLCQQTRKVDEDWGYVLGDHNVQSLKRQAYRFRSFESIFAALTPCEDTTQLNALTMAMDQKPFPADVPLPLPAQIVLIRSSFIIKWAKLVCSGQNQGLPCRQRLEREYPEALMTVEELQKMVDQFQALAPNSDHDENDFAEHSERFDTLPIVCLSYRWRGKMHPDPKGRTCVALARLLEEEIQGVQKSRHYTTGYSAWGYPEVGVFIDWCSMYQKSHAEDDGTGWYEDKETLTSANGAETSSFTLCQKPERRGMLPDDGMKGWFETRQHGWSFRHALANMTTWYAHRSTMVYCILGLPDDEEYNHLEYINAGWPFFEFNVAHWTKQDHTNEFYSLRNGTSAQFWKMIRLEGADDVGVDEASLKRSHSGKSCVDLLRLHRQSTFQFCFTSGNSHPPPIPPEYMTEALNEGQKKFTNQADGRIVAMMYEEGLRHCYSYRVFMDYCDLGWGIAEVNQLCDTLLEPSLNCPRLRVFDLSKNSLGPDGVKLVASMLGTEGTLPALEVLSLNQVGMQDEGLAHLASALEGRREHANGILQAGVRFLHLDQNRITDQGANGLSIMMGAIPTLTQISVAHNMLKGEGSIAIAREAVRHRQLLRLDLRQQEDLLTREQFDQLNGIFKEGSFNRKFDSESALQHGARWYREARRWAKMKSVTKLSPRAIAQSSSN